MRFVDSRTRSFFESFTGRMMSASPSVLTSSGVSFVMSSNYPPKAASRQRSPATESCASSPVRRWLSPPLSPEAGPS